METVPGKNLKCIVVTPEKAVLDETVDFVALPMIDGELGVLPGRAPLIGQLGFGELRTVRGDQTRRYFTDGGFAQVRENVVTVLTSRAIPAADINVSSAQEALQAAQKPALSPQARESQWKAQARARAMIRIGQRAKESTPAH